MDENKIYFFGYGANRDARKIGKVLGKVPIACTGAVIEGYSLFSQNLDQIPEPAKGVLKSVWGNDSRTYTINPGKGLVAGVIWEITKDDLEIIKDWEFVGSWREIVSVKVKTFDERTVDAFTDKAIKSDLNVSFYDGLNYPNNLNANQNIITDTEIVEEDIYKIEKLKQLRREILVVSQTTVS